MKYLIINADDFGYSKSINEGIRKGINHGVITSTSLMVDGKYSDEVKEISNNKNISIGLHFVLPKEMNSIAEEFNKQLEKFETLVNRKPDHLDSHKVLPKDVPELHDVFNTYSKENNTPIRDWGHANFIDSFFGLNVDSSGELDTSKVSVDSLIDITKNELVEGYNEMMCHAAYVDEELMKLSSYNKPREIELNSLLSDRFSVFLEQSKGEIQLISWKEVKLD